MKIIIAHKHFYRRDGSTTYLFDLIDLLKEHGHEVIPFAMQHPSNERTPWSKYFVSFIDFEHPTGLREKIHVAMRMIYSHEAKRTFESLVREVKPDIVHIQNIYHQISPSILDVCRKYHIPVVQTVNDYKLICPNYKLFCSGKIETLCKGGMFYREVFNRCTKRSFFASVLTAIEMYIHKWMHIYDKGVNYWIAPSKAVKDLLVEYGMPKTRIVTMYYPLDTTMIAPATTVGSYLLCYGRLSEEKGFDTAIRAMKVLRDYRLKIAGVGPQQEYLKQLCIKEGISDRVDFLGFVKGIALKKLVRQSALVLMPSIWYEVLGYSMTEAMAMGKAVLGARIGGIAEVLDMIDNRLLFIPGDYSDMAKKAQILLSNPHVSQQLGQKSRSWVQKNLFPLDHYNKLMELYKKAIKSQKKP
ncbi:MAG: glycosyltransferase family 4 protein [bacterium]|nr:glycosyltransferase family 4 protein [bacterium]